MSQPPYTVRNTAGAAKPGFGLSRTMLRGGLSIALAAGVGLAMATAAFANGGSKPSPSPCAGTAPITTPCVATPVQAGSSYTIVLPGIGTVNFTVDQITGKVTGTPTATPLALSGYTATIKVDADTDRLVVVFTNTDPTKSVALIVKTKPGPNGTAPVVKAKVKAVHHDDDEATETDHDTDKSGQPSTFGFGHD